MIAGLKPYPRMKDSGVAWLGEVPEHWEVRRLKWCAGLNPSRTEARELLFADVPVTFLPMERVSADGRVDAREKVAASVAWLGFTYFKKGDVLVAKITPCFENGKGACLDSLPTDIGFGSTEFHVLRAKASVLPQFLYRLTTISEFRRLGADAMTGAAGQQRVPQSFIENFPAGLPPLAEQAAIVRFLDHADRRIRRYVRAKQKLIKLLEEQKQAIIHQAVTGRVDVRTGQPYPAYKNSGVEWLGEVPEHWEVRSFTRCAVERADYRGATPIKTDSGVFLVTAKNIRKGWIDYEGSQEYVSQRDYPTIMRRGLPRIGDLLLTTEAPLGNAALVDREDVALAQRVIRFRMDSELLISEFALQAVLCPYFQHQLLQRGTGSTALGIKASKLPQLQILCPPLTEQQAILDWLDSECAPIYTTIVRARSEIDLLHEYRTRLIADVVTGKLDVREAAARLPDEGDDLLPDAADDDSTPDEPADDLDAVPEDAEA